MKCVKCGKEFNARAAISRIDGSNICSLCGSIEAMEDAGWTEEQKKEAIRLIENKK